MKSAKVTNLLYTHIVHHILKLNTSIFIILSTPVIMEGILLIIITQWITNFNLPIISANTDGVKRSTE